LVASVHLLPHISPVEVSGEGILERVSRIAIELTDIINIDVSCFGYQQTQKGVTEALSNLIEPSINGSLFNLSNIKK